MKIHLSKNELIIGVEEKKDRKSDFFLTHHILRLKNFITFAARLDRV